jgi:hypothetical protein
MDTLEYQAKLALRWQAQLRGWGIATFSICVDNYGETVTVAHPEGVFRVQGHDVFRYDQLREGHVRCEECKAFWRGNLECSYAVPIPGKTGFVRKKVCEPCYVKAGRPPDAIEPPKFKKGQKVFFIGKAEGDTLEHGRPYTVTYVSLSNVVFEEVSGSFNPDRFELVTPAQPEAFRVGDLVLVRLANGDAPEFVVDQIHDNGVLSGIVGDRRCCVGSPGAELVYRASQDALAGFQKEESRLWMLEREKERPGCLFWIGGTNAPVASDDEGFALCHGGWRPSPRHSQNMRMAVEGAVAHPESVRRWRASQKATTQAGSGSGDAPKEPVSSPQPEPAGHLCAFCHDPGSKWDPLVEGMHSLCGEQKRRQEPAVTVSKPDPYAAYRNKYDESTVAEHMVASNANYHLCHAPFRADVVPPSKQKPVVHPWHADESEP